MGQLDRWVEDVVSLAIRVLKDRNSPIWTRGVVSHHQSRGEEAAVVATERERRDRKKRYSHTFERGLSRSYQREAQGLTIPVAATVEGPPSWLKSLSPTNSLSGSVVQLAKLTHAEL